MTTWKWLLVSALALGMVACGDDDTVADTGVDSSLPDASEDGSVDAGTDTEVPGMTIADIAAGNPDFSILLSLAQRVGLDAALAADEELTVFAPVNSAFDGIDPAELTDEQVMQILNNHIVAGTVLAAGIPARADNLADLTLLFDTAADPPTVNGVDITGADNIASNGVVHIVDAVIMPATIADLAGIAGLTSLAGALTTAELLDTVADPEADLTVFAPTDAAFTAAGEVPEDALANILLYHVVSGTVLAADVPALAPSLATNEFENNLTLLFDTTDGVSINGATPVDLADVKAVNGVVHVIGDVLLPLNVVTAATAAGLSELTGAVGAAADLDGTPVAEVLSGEGAFTVLAPNNAAFEAVAETVEGLSDEELRDVLLYHLVDSDTPVLEAGLPDGDAPTLNGATVTIDPSGPTVNGEDILITDVNVTNGVVHIIGGVLIPPAG